MSKSKFELLKGLIGLVLCVLAVAGIYYWESYGRIKYTKKEVVVLNESVQPLTIIKNEHLAYEKRDVSDLINEPIVNKDQIIGKMAKHYIPGKSQLCEAYFASEGLLPKEGEYIFQLPRSWVASMPSTLRRSDDAYLYPVRNGQSNELASQDEYAVATSQSEEAIKCLKIAFVRNQANQEVKTVGESDRLEANSTIANIEVIATLEDIKQLNALRKQGYSFIVMYR